MPLGEYEDGTSREYLDTVSPEMPEPKQKEGRIYGVTMKTTQRS